MRISVHAKSNQFERKLEHKDMTNSIFNNFIFYNFKKFDSVVDWHNPPASILPSDPNSTWTSTRTWSELNLNFTTRLRNVVIRVHHLRWMSQRVVFWREERALCRIAICQLSNNFILAFKEETKSRQGRTMTSLQGEGGKMTWILELDFWLKRVWSEKNCTLTFMYYYSTSETIQRIE